MENNGNQFIHVKNLEKFHPGYKDRNLVWAKIYFNMVQGDPDCELIDNEIDWARLVKFIILELQAKKPIPLNSQYLSKKGFDLKKRPISLTLNVLQNFIITVREESETCVLEKKREEKKREEENGVTDILICFQKWNEFAPKYNLSKINSLTKDRKAHLKNRCSEPAFNFDKILEIVSGTKFLLGSNDRGWKIDFDFIIKNENNYNKILEGKYGKCILNNEDVIISETMKEVLLKNGK